MPNPFMRSGTPNQSGRRKGPDNFGDVQEADTGVGYTAGPMTPIATNGEHIEPHVNPYRGMETHGVTPTVEWHDVNPITPGDAVVEFEIPDAEPDPIPVRIVYGDKGMELTRGNVVHAYALPIVEQRLIGRDAKRKTAKITNLHATDTVYISVEQGVQPYTGYPIKPGAEFVSTANGALWVIAGGANQVELAVYTETAYQE